MYINEDGFPCAFMLHMTWRGRRQVCLEPKSILFAWANRLLDPEPRECVSTCRNATRIRGRKKGEHEGTRCLIRCRGCVLGDARRFRVSTIKG